MADSQAQYTVDLNGLAFALYQLQKQQQQIMQQYSNKSQQQPLTENDDDLYNEEVVEEDLHSFQDTQNQPLQNTQTSTSSVTTGTAKIGLVMDDVDIDELLINEIKSYKCLWDTSCRSYKEKPKKDESWRLISAKLQTEGS